MSSITVANRTDHPPTTRNGPASPHPIYAVTGDRLGYPGPVIRVEFHPGTHSRDGAHRYADYRRYSGLGNHRTAVEVRDCHCEDFS